MKRAHILLACTMALAMALPSAAGAQGVDWNAVLRALGGAMDSWRSSPFPRTTPTAVRTPASTRTPSSGSATRTRTPSRTATSTRVPPTTRIPTATRTETFTRVPTRTLTPSRTATESRTPTETRTPTSTRPRTDTATPRPTSTPVPTRPNDGQIAFASAEGIPPEQRLASAFLVFPYIVANATQDTRIEIMNMSDQQVDLQCFYVRKSDCVEIGFFVSLTARQPLTWLADEGTNNPLTFSAVPPFNGEAGGAEDGRGELKCAVAAMRPEISAHNVIQGRSLVFDRLTGETVGQGAIGFQRLSPGPYTGIIDLDGFTYESCPDRLHFQVLTKVAGGPTSELVTVTCSEDLLNQIPVETVVQLQIINEFEQVFSSSYRFKCIGRTPFTSFSTLQRSTLGTDTAHVIARGVSTPLMGLVIERFTGQAGSLHTTANEPFLEGGRSSTVIFP